MREYERIYRRSTGNRQLSERKSERRALVFQGKGYRERSKNVAVFNRWQLIPVVKEMQDAEYHPVELFNVDHMAG
jgi:hypothetical protein